MDLNKDGGISQEELDTLFVNTGVLDAGITPTNSSVIPMLK